MALNRLGAPISSHYFLPVVLVLLLTFPYALHADITPEREIVPVDAPEIPLWKSYWDAGRNLAREGKYVTAAEYYKELILRKPQIEEAKWEYCKILFKLEDYDVAAPLLESLLESNLYEEDYLFMAGNVALRIGEYNRAVRYLGQFYTRRPEGVRGEMALSGLVEALKELGRADKAFILMEQLRQRKEEDTELLHMLAATAYEIGLVEKAADYYALLLENQKIEASVLQEAAERLSVAGYKESAANVWRRLLKLSPDNVTYHRRLKEFYLEKGEASAALPHILAILENDKNFDPALLLRAGRIYANEMGRPDRSIRYFERYLQLVSQDHSAAEELEQVRSRVAQSLIPIVENNGAELLWEDLGKITQNGLAIFRVMAEKLEATGNKESLIALWKVIYEHSLSKSLAALHLTQLYAEKEQYADAYEYVTSIENFQMLPAEHLLLRAHIEEKVGKDVDAFHSLMVAWKKNPSIPRLESRILRMSGQLGLLDELEQIGRPLVTTSLLKRNFPLYLDYIEGLRLNGKIEAAESIYARLLNTDWADKEIRGKILLHKAETLKRADDSFQSEKILRMLLVDGVGKREAIVQLIGHAVASQSIEDGWALFRYYLKRFPEENWQKSNDIHSQDLFDAYICLLGTEEEYETATDEIEWYLDQHWGTVKGKGTDDNLISRFAEKLGRFYLIAGKFDKLPIFQKRYGNLDALSGFDILAEAIRAGKGTADSSVVMAQLAGNSQITLRRLFSLAEEARLLHQENVSLAIYSRIIERNPNSVRARILIADLQQYLGMIEESATIYRDLHDRFPEERYFYRKYLELEYKRGNYNLILEELEDKNLHFLPMAFKLLQTRTYWANKQHKVALLSYKELLNPPVISLFKQRLAEKRMDFNWEEDEKRTFWNIFTYKQPDQLEKLNSFTAENGFLSYVNTPIGEIAAALYEKYRWEKLIKSEYQLKKAVEENKYISAKKSYFPGVDSGKKHSAESLKDLAQIYERLGDYEKEAEVYSHLKDRGEMTPELDAFIKRNERARAPTIGVMYGNRSREGRDGAINVIKEIVGPEFQFSPGITSEITLSYNELTYSQATGDDTINGKYLKSEAQLLLGTATRFDFGFGYHSLDTDGDETIITNIRIEHELDELLTGFVEYRQQVVDDTLDALEDGIYHNSVIGGLSLEGTTGFNLGTEYSHRTYNDDNTQDRIYFWTGYSWFSKFTTIELLYSYEMFSNRLEGTDTTAEGDEIVDAPPVTLENPYWSPDDYWQHQFTVRFHHLLKQLAVFSEAPSHYSLDLSVGYESSEVFTYSGGFDIFLEMSSNFLLKGELHYSNSDQYREHSAQLSMLYRW